MNEHIPLSGRQISISNWSWNMILGSVYICRNKKGFHIIPSLMCPAQHLFMSWTSMVSLKVVVTCMCVGLCLPVRVVSWRCWSQFPFFVVIFVLRDSNSTSNMTSELMSWKKCCQCIKAPRIWYVWPEQLIWEQISWTTVLWELMWSSSHLNSSSVTMARNVLNNSNIS